MLSQRRCTCGLLESHGAALHQQKFPVVVLSVLNAFQTMREYGGITKIRKFLMALGRGTSYTSNFVPSKVECDILRSFARMQQRSLLFQCA